MFQLTQTFELIPEEESVSTSTLGTSVSNPQIAEVLFNIATLLEMQQGNPYRIEAYRNAARGLMALREPATDIIGRKERLELPGLGDRLRYKITEFVTTGHMTFYHDLCEESLPEDVRSLMVVRHVGPRIALRLNNTLGIHSVADLYEAARTHKLREQYGFGPRSELRLEEGARAVLRAQQAPSTQPAQSGASKPQAA